jgi:diketogulonate reductase-like aldo/keto reductase
MEKAVELGLTKSIGVSNCPVIFVIDILTYCKIKPVTNQVEVHPYFSRQNFIDFHKKFDITITAYAPIGAPGF